MTTPNDTPAPRTEAALDYHAGHDAFDVNYHRMKRVSECSRQLERELADALAWKQSMLKLESTWDEQAVGRLLGLPLGSDIRSQILPGIDKLQRELAEADRSERDALGRFDERVAEATHSYLLERDAAREELARVKAELDEANKANLGLELVKAGREAENEDHCELSRRLKDIAIYDITKAHPAYAKLNALTLDLFGVAIHLFEARMPSTYGKGAVRRLAETQGILAIAEAELQAAQSEAKKWRECAELFFRSCNPRISDAINNSVKSQALNLYAALCRPTPPPSPQSSSEPAAICYHCGTPQQTVLAHGKMFCSLQCAGRHSQELSGPPSARIAQDQNAAAPDEATASRLAALESKLELLRRRTEYLLERFCVLKTFLATVPDIRWSVESPTEWPADLALTESTYTSQPTSGPESSGEGK